MNPFTSDAPGRRLSRMERGPGALWRCERGQDVAEMAMVLPFLLLVVLGIVEFGTIFSAQHTLTSIGREGANIGARGAALEEVNGLMLASGSPLDLQTRGGAISSRVVVLDGAPMIVEQVASPGLGSLSRLGREDDEAAGLASLADDEGASFYVVELFLAHRDRTPLRRLLPAGVPDTLYSRAVF